MKRPRKPFVGTNKQITQTNKVSKNQKIENSEEVDDYMTLLISEPNLDEDRSKIHKKISEPQKPRRLLEEEKRMEGLSKPLDQSNKGFLMLQKMIKNIPSSDPAANIMDKPNTARLDLKLDRAGLGFGNNDATPFLVEDNVLFKRKKQGLGSIHEINTIVENSVNQTNEFKSHNKTKYMDRKINGQFWSALKTLISLEENEERKSDNSMYSIRLIPLELRNKLMGNGSIDEKSANEEEKEEGEELKQWRLREESLTVNQKTERLASLLEFLRETYYYCLYCGAQYDSHDELETQCPGKTEDDH